MANELILIVEDNPKNLKLVRDRLQVTGYQTIEAETGEEGVRLAHERRPALILMDIQLPGINGVEALQQLRVDPMTSAITARESWPLGSTAFTASRSASGNCWPPCGRSSTNHEPGRRQQKPISGLTPSTACHCRARCAGKEPVKI